MDTKIISSKIVEKQAGKNHPNNYCDGAWSFAYTVLWPQHQFSREEVASAQQCIRTYFDNAANKNHAFTALCERVILAADYVRSKAGRYVPSPSLWFNSNYNYGFAGTKSWLDSVEIKRQSMPNYLCAVSTIADYYLKYVIRPSRRTFNGCRKKLTEQSAFLILQYFYNAVIHFKYIK